LIQIGPNDASLIDVPAGSKVLERERIRNLSSKRLARQVGLRHVNDEIPGIIRRRRGKGFSYLKPDGSVLRDPSALGRIRRLAIPPAWTEVWICSSESGHIQAVGRDARGRKQYRYHEKWNHGAGRVKYERLLAFGNSLPDLRRRIRRDLAKPGLPREKVLAAVVSLLERTLIRVGYDEYARTNRSYGLTTLRDRHALVKGKMVQFRFQGKSGKLHVIRLSDRQLARIVQECRNLPGEELFQYLDEDGAKVDVTPAGVNAYLRENTGRDFTAKDFRTWAGSVLMIKALSELEPPQSKGEASRNLKQAIAAVAGLLGNTPAVCRKSYIHPAVMEAYAAGQLPGKLGENSERPDAGKFRGYKREEEALLRLLRSRKGGGDD